MSADATPIARRFVWSGAIAIDNGALDAAKCIGLVAMTIDHVNTYLLHGGHAWMYQVGRLAMPLFAIALAARLAAPEALQAGGRAQRMTARLTAFGLAAQIPFTLLRGGPWPPTLLNTMLLLLLVVMFLRLHASEKRSHRIGAWIWLLVGGAAVEFWWIGAAVILAVRAWLADPSARSAIATGCAFAALCVLTRSLVPLLAPAIVYGLARGRVAAPRAQLVFYCYYPLHLAVLLAFGGGSR